MPGGKITAKQDLPDLKSYLARKRCPLDKWLAANNITTPEALNSLISSNKWNVSQELHDLISELVKPVYIPSAPIVDQALLVVVETVIKEEPVAVEQIIEQQAVLDIEEQVVLEPEEPIQIVEEVSIVSSHSVRERKKSR